MKKALLLFCLATFSIAGFSQTDHPAIIFQSNQIAEKMSDSLSLSAVQKDSILNMTTRLFMEFDAIYKQQHTQDSLRLHLQNTENKRDVWYQTILTETQFTKYRKLKVELIYGMQ